MILFPFLQILTSNIFSVIPFPLLLNIHRQCLPYKYLIQMCHIQIISFYLLLSKTTTIIGTDLFMILSAGFKVLFKQVFNCFGFGHEMQILSAGFQIAHSWVVSSRVQVLFKQVFNCCGLGLEMQILSAGFRLLALG